MSDGARQMRDMGGPPPPPVLHVDISDFTAGVQELKQAMDHVLGCSIVMKDGQGRELAWAGITAVKGEVAEKLLELLPQVVGALGGHIEIATEGVGDSLATSLGICGKRKQLPGEHEQVCALPPDHDGLCAFDR